MSKKCSKCKNWLQIKKTLYDDGSEIINWSSSDKDNGHCNILKIETKSDFGCISFERGEHEEITHKTGSPWDHYVLIPCPDCNGRGSLIESQRHCGRCVGTAAVPKWDDGYIGDQRTRKHPKDQVKVKQDNSGFVLKKPESAKEGVI